MPKVTFARDYDCPFPGGFVAYKAGFSGLIPTEHARRAADAGALIDGERKREAPGKAAGKDTAGREGRRRD